MDSVAKWFHVRREAVTDALCFCALVLMPWQARWIFSYHLLNSERYEYGVFSIYAASLFVIAACALLWRRGWMRTAKIFVSILIAWLVLTTLFSFDASVASYYLFTGILAFGYCIIGTLWERMKLVRSFIIAGLAQTVIAWMQFVNQRVQASTFLGVAEHLPQILGQSVIIINSSRILRAYALLPHPNILGGFLVVVFALLIYQFSMHERLETEEQSRRSRTAYSTMILFVFSGILISFSRAALVSAVLFVVGWLVFTFSVGQAPVFKKIGRAAIICCALFLVFNLVASNAWLGRFSVLFGSSASSYSGDSIEQRSVDERIVSYHEAQVLMNTRSLVVGIGLGNYVPRLAQAFPSLAIYDYQPVHNGFVMMLLEIGAIGTVFLGWFIFWLIKDAWREARVSLRDNTQSYNALVLFPFSVLGLLCFMALFDHFLWTSFFGQSLVWLVIGFAAHRFEGKIPRI